MKNSMMTLIALFLTLAAVNAEAAPVKTCPLMRTNVQRTLEICVHDAVANSRTLVAALKDIQGLAEGKFNVVKLSEMGDGGWIGTTFMVYVPVVPNADAGGWIAQKNLLFLVTTSILDPDDGSGTKTLTVDELDLATLTPSTSAR